MWRTHQRRSNFQLTAAFVLLSVLALDLSLFFIGDGQRTRHHVHVHAYSADTPNRDIFVMVYHKTGWVMTEAMMNNLVGPRDYKMGEFWGAWSRNVYDNAAGQFRREPRRTYGRRRLLPPVDPIGQTHVTRFLSPVISKTMLLSESKKSADTSVILHYMREPVAWLASHYVYHKEGNWGWENPHELMPLKYIQGKWDTSAVGRRLRIQEELDSLHDSIQHHSPRKQFTAVLKRLPLAEGLRLALCQLLFAHDNTESTKNHIYRFAENLIAFDDFYSEVGNTGHIKHLMQRDLTGSRESALKTHAVICQGITGQTYSANIDDGASACVDKLQEAQFHPEASRVVKQNLKGLKQHKSNYVGIAGMTKLELHQTIRNDPLMAPILAAVNELMMKVVTEQG